MKFLYVVQLTKLNILSKYHKIGIGGLLIIKGKKLRYGAWGMILHDIGNFSSPESLLSVKGNTHAIQGWGVISTVFQERTLRAREKLHQRERNICTGKNYFTVKTLVNQRCQVLM